MDASVSSSIFDNYHGWLSLFAFLGVFGVTIIGENLLLRIPVLKEVYDLNQEAAKERNSRDYYPAVQKKSMRWGLMTHLAVFLFIIPFSITLEAASIWEILLDIFVILMVYDFFYYLTHRYLFHDGPLGGPLIWVHAVHHQAMDPCRLDSSYLHPIEPCIGLALYGVCIGALSLIMGEFHLVTIILTWIAFSQINQHNHDLMDAPYFPFKYLNFMSSSHHVHHQRFTSGNFATITLLFDWLFGTYDAGNGYKNTPEESEGTKKAVAMGEAAAAVEVAEPAEDTAEEGKETKED